MTDTAESVRSVLPYADGRFVHYSDYLALQNRYAALLERIEKAPTTIVEECGFIQDKFDNALEGKRVALVQVED